ncbi:PucR family transcriptional regulator [Isoptericola jiangsuensis]|uniref:PucR family transcriptional regulator n=1 Tax=Isoptericola jiangsuensis TaxID=548579 RepID=UPI003AAE85F0
MPATAATGPVAPVEDAGPTRHDLVGALLDGTCRLADVPRLAVLLGSPAHGTYLVVAVAGATPAERVGVRAALTAPGSAHWHTTTTVDHGIVRVDDDREVDVDLTSAAAPTVRAGVGLPVTSLARVDEARRLADLALSMTAPTGGSVRLADRLPEAIVHRGDDLAGALALRVLGPVLAGPPEERDVLLGTLSAWFDADGNAAATAAVLGCHRNTVTNRLHRLEQLTGRSTDRPRDLVDLALALQATGAARTRH